MIFALVTAAIGVVIFLVACALDEAGPGLIVLALFSAVAFGLGFSSANTTKEHTRMGMSSHVVAFSPPTPEFLKMKAAYDACRAAGVPVPVEIERYFSGNVPTEHGMEIDHRALENAGVITECRNDMQEGFDIDLSKLPAHVKRLRFYNSW